MTGSMEWGRGSSCTMMGLGVKSSRGLRLDRLVEVGGGGGLIANELDEDEDVGLTAVKILGGSLELTRKA